MQKDEFQLLAELVLPDGILDYFTINKVDQGLEVSSIYLEEKNELPKGYTREDYESKGFYKAKIIQDFPIRGKQFI